MWQYLRRGSGTRGSRFKLQSSCMSVLHKDSRRSKNIKISLYSEEEWAAARWPDVKPKTPRRAFWWDRTQTVIPRHSSYFTLKLLWHTSSRSRCWRNVGATLTGNEKLSLWHLEKTFLQMILTRQICVWDNNDHFVWAPGRCCTCCPSCEWRLANDSSEEQSVSKSRGGKSWKDRHPVCCRGEFQQWWHRRGWSGKTWMFRCASIKVHVTRVSREETKNQEVFMDGCFSALRRRRGEHLWDDFTRCFTGFFEEHVHSDWLWATLEEHSTGWEIVEEPGVFLFIVDRRSKWAATGISSWNFWLLNQCHFGKRIQSMFSLGLQTHAHVQKNMNS